MTAVRVLALLLALAPVPALANGPDCGGDAYSSATIGANPPGPLTAVPDTLCADLDQGQAPSTRIEIIAPGYGTQGYSSPGYSSPGYGSTGLPPYGATGDRYAPAPYGGRPPLGPRPRGGRDPER